jgi:hypothetical protein
VPINDWWAGDPAERYWMEITDRPEDELGADLNAPTLNGAGRREWSYSLITETRPSDVVFHWHSRLAAIVGWSEVVGPLTVDSSYLWMAHGTFGRARGVPTKGQGWRMPCGGLNPLPQPITSAQLRELEPQLRDVKDKLEQRVNGSLYFPFQFSRSRPPRAAQAYLTKLPAALLSVLTDLPAPEKSERPARAGRVQDSELRGAIEQYAVDQARWYYQKRGATEIIALGKPYDLLVKGLGPDRHVEVKGSSRLRQSVELTVNEVWHAHNHEPTDLVVVDRIDIARNAAGQYELSGGVLRVLENWRPDEADLSPTRYLYDLPEMRTP